MIHGERDCALLSVLVVALAREKVRNVASKIRVVLNNFKKNLGNFFYSLICNNSFQINKLPDQ